MNAFDIRLKNNLFPKTPEWYSKTVHSALRAAGVQPKPKYRVRAIHIAIAAAAAAASFAVILFGAFLHNTSPDIRPLSSAGTILDPTPRQSDTVPLASKEPDEQNVTTRVIAAKDTEGLYTDADAEHYGRIILSFLSESGEPQPDELWILRIRPLHDDLPADDTGSYVSNVLLLAQSKFGESDGPDLYCIQGHKDGEVLWGTQDGAAGPSRVCGTFHGGQRWVLFGTNTTADGSLGHVKGCYLTGREDGTDIEFSAFLTTEESRKPFENSRHLDCLSEYYLTVVAESDLEAVEDRSLLLVTEKSNYAFPIRDNVPELQVLTQADLELIRENNKKLATHLSANDETTVFNLTNLDDDSAKNYAEAVLSRLKQDGTEPKELWLCAAARFAFSEQSPHDEAYLLCLYAFEGETGPELFHYLDGTILWQTKGYDPFCINTVNDPIKRMNCAFGFSPAFDNVPVESEKGQLTLRDAEGRIFQDDSTLFYPERPLFELPRLLSDSKYADMAREAFIHPYAEELQLVSCVFTAKDGREYTAPYGINAVSVQR